MNFLEFQKKLINDFNWINHNVFDKIEIYKKFLQEENKKFNLTRFDSEDKIYSSYFYESIFVYKDVIENIQQEILDIGSGSGIPGILLAIIFDKSNITIVESNSKKCYFMNDLIEILSIKNVVIINQRAECLDKKMRESFDIGTSRAVSSLKNLIEIITPYLKINGVIVQPKSKQLDFELEKAQTMITKLNLFEEAIIEKEFNGKTHNILVLKKVQKTNLIYPRSWNEIINDK